MIKVAFVIVSHSEPLARGLAELAAQMAPDVHFEAAGGTDDGGLGTSYDRIESAVDRALAAVDDGPGCGVVVSTDLGSATMTADAVVEIHDEAGRIALVDAPIVEGTIAAAVRAQLGDPLKAVAAAATSAWMSRIDGEGADGPDGAADPQDPAQEEATRPSSPDGQVRADAVVADPVGLHARPAALLARLAGTFDAQITVDGADAASVLEIMALGVPQGRTVSVVATGNEASEAVAALVDMLEGRTP
ncbi:dihydroxyacetone kinase phosphoryl donor subunit DhaM [Actinomyces sp. B33]|uniref:dihydroxyacetone kinase phosphoryl donor subunit DhaM n=1 Tax=Actinomyces sp. B33 TaxID=2942131 RepID=UPI0023414E45|nr:dihydroxyacetone kinase phosphoryl donor subunit DhaM [Actinomyces sp. B33]MDC4233175.1 dihydroxyacetone kinase phosphoryl donor subunit DhaM [Actinomyces sp. B33]